MLNEIHLYYAKYCLGIYLLKVRYSDHGHDHTKPHHTTPLIVLNSNDSVIQILTVLGFGDL